MKTQFILERLDRIESILLKTNDATYLNHSEAAEFIGVSPSYLYKLTHKGQIPYYKPNGGRLQFKKSELCDWIESSQGANDAEIDILASNYFINNPINLK